MCSMISLTFILVPCSCCLCRRNEKLEGILKFSDKYWRLHNTLIVDCNLPSLLDCQTRRDGLQKLRESGLIESKEKRYSHRKNIFGLFRNSSKNCPSLKATGEKLQPEMLLFSPHIYTSLILQNYKPNSDHTATNINVQSEEVMMNDVYRQRQINYSINQV